MSTDKTLEIKSISSNETETIAGQIGRRLKGGELIELVSDLGGGKTTFVRGLAHGLGSADTVSSPTFTISKVYKAGTLELHHFDFYRLHDAGLAAYELQDLLGDPGVVIVMEWAEVVADVLPENRLTITITHTSDQGRTLSFTCPEPLCYLLEDL